MGESSSSDSARARREREGGVHVEAALQVVSAARVQSRVGGPRAGSVERGADRPGEPAGSREALAISESISAIPRSLLAAPPTQ